jgi:diphthamide synthase (EF-2-diphthine--ammonia ligase)
MEQPQRQCLEASSSSAAGEYEVVGLVTTFNREANRVAMHEVRRELVEPQAEAAGIPLWDVDMPSPCSNADYENIMREECRAAVRSSIECVAFGDLLLRDIGEHRERQLPGSGLTPISLVWGLPTNELARTMIASGPNAKLTCVDSQLLSAEFVGKEFDEELLSELPAVNRLLRREWRLPFVRVRSPDIPA